MRGSRPEDRAALAGRGVPDVLRAGRVRQPPFFGHHEGTAVPSWDLPQALSGVTTLPPFTDRFRTGRLSPPGRAPRRRLLSCHHASVALGGRKGRAPAENRGITGYNTP